MSKRLIFIHGIKQDPEGKDLLRDRWRDLLIENETIAGIFAATQPEMVFYADVLGPAAIASGIIGMGPTAAAAATDQGEAAFVGTGLREMARSMGVTEEEIGEAADREVGATAVIAQSSAAGRMLVGALAAIEGRLPAAGIVGVRVLKEAYLYLTRPLLRDQIDQRAREVIEPAIAAGEQIVIVSHSLGTVVGFRILRELAKKHTGSGTVHSNQNPVALLITMGSPLSLATVRKHIGLPTSKPPLIDRWVNYFDKGDLVALGKGLSTDAFGEGVENDGDVDNTTFNAHGIEGYLSHRHVVEAIQSTL